MFFLEHGACAGDRIDDFVDDQLCRLAQSGGGGDVRIERCLRCLLLVMCTHPFTKEALTLHLARSEGHERYFGCNLMHRKVLASSHQHLMAEAPNDAMDWIAMCLQKWSSDRPASGHGHGLPQGPLASDFLAECFLLPIDLVLQKHRGYMRYVDDVRLLGATENEVRRICLNSNTIAESAG